MNRPIKNKCIEDLAQKIAEAINAEDAQLYESLMKNSEEQRSRMKRWEVIAFRDRVHFIANTSKKENS